MATTHLLHSAWRWLHAFMFVLVAALIILAVVRGATGAAIVAAVIFTFSLAGWEWSRVLGKTWSPALMLVTVAAFAIFLYYSEDAAFLAFPLFFAITHAYGGWRSVAYVSVLTLVTILVLLRHSGPGIGSIIGPAIGAGVALAVGLGFRLLITESQARADAISELIETKAQATEMARAAGELSERTRLAGDIHDTVAQGLSSIQLLLHSAEKKAVELGDSALVETLQLARQTAAQNLSETRRIIAALQPEPLAGSSLPVALARVCSTTPMGNAVRFHVDGPATELPEPLESALVRITQTLLANVVAHAHATRANVTLTFGSDAVSLDVVDDGVGFDPASVGPNSYGLAGVRRRVDKLGGTVTIESDGGTGVSVRIPVEVSHD